MRPFPLDSMSDPSDHEGGRGGSLIPCMFFRNPTDAIQVKDLPILHISQNLTLRKKIPIYQPFHQECNSSSMDPPIQIHPGGRVMSIQPKNIGTFVSTRTLYFQLDGE
mmetsp:Transcript_27831/g.57194  ORF Transcript_27831/g.57194 Transcript_27831/m.57194 type:complete len:108 (+) Transcript_27831:256-579(+)